MVIAVVGASLLDLEVQTGCTIQQAALLLTWSSLGRLPGSLLAAIIFDRFAADFQLMVALALPWLNSYVVLSVLIFTQGVVYRIHGIR